MNFFDYLFKIIDTPGKFFGILLILIVLFIWSRADTKKDIEVLKIKGAVTDSLLYESKKETKELQLRFIDFLQAQLKQ